MSTWNTTLFLIVACTVKSLFLNAYFEIVNEPRFFFLFDSHRQRVNIVLQDIHENCFTGAVPQHLQLLFSKQLFVGYFAHLFFKTFLVELLNYFQQLNKNKVTFFRTALYGFSAGRYVLIKSLAFSPKEVEMDNPQKETGI